MILLCLSITRSPDCRSPDIFPHPTLAHPPAPYSTAQGETTVYRKLLLLCLVNVLLVSVGRADQITLTNGDRITGSIKSSDGTALTIKTDYAGELTVKWEAIKSISSDQPLYVSSKDGQ